MCWLFVQINSQCLPSGGPTGEGEASEDEEEEEDGSGAVEECLKRLLGRNQLTDAQCRLEVAAVVEEERADIHTDPLLHQACAIDLAKFCADVPAGGGQRKFLQGNTVYIFMVLYSSYLITFF